MLRAASIQGVVQLVDFGPLNFDRCLAVSLKNELVPFSIRIRSFLVPYENVSVSLRPY